MRLHREKQTAIITSPTLEFEPRRFLTLGKWLMVAGATILLLGAVLHFAPGLLSWFGRLPGDIRINSERGSVFIPLTSMIIVSVVVSLLISLFRR